MNKKGFTLLELLVVIAILGILVTLASLTYNKILKSSKQSIKSVNIAEIVSSAKSYGTDFAEEVKKDGTLIVKPSYLYDKGYLDKDLKDFAGVVKIYIEDSTKTDKNSNNVTAEYYENYYTISINITNGTSDGDKVNELYNKYFVSSNDFIYFNILGNAGYGNPKSTCTTESKCDITVNRIRFKNLSLQDVSYNINYTLGEYLIEYQSNYNILSNNGENVNNVLKTTTGSSSQVLALLNNYQYSYTSLDNEASASINANKTLLTIDNITKDTICNIYYKKAFSWKVYSINSGSVVEQYNCNKEYKEVETVIFNSTSTGGIFLDPLTLDNVEFNRNIYTKKTFFPTTGLFSISSMTETGSLLDGYCITKKYISKFGEPLYLNLTTSEYQVTKNKMCAIKYNDLLRVHNPASSTSNLECIYRINKLTFTKICGEFSDFLLSSTSSKVNINDVDEKYKSNNIIENIVSIVNGKCECETCDENLNESLYYYVQNNEIIKGSYIETVYSFDKRSYPSNGYNKNQCYTTDSLGNKVEDYTKCNWYVLEK